MVPALARLRIWTTGKLLWHMAEGGAALSQFAIASDGGAAVVVAS
jgi:hypothetical protein